MTRDPVTSANLAVALEAGATEGGWTGDLAFIAGERTYTHAQVHDGAARTGSLLAGLGVNPGARVLIALPDGVEFAWAFLGAARIGAMAVPVNPRLTVADHMVAAAGAAAVVCGRDLCHRFGGRPVVVGEDLEAALAQYPPAAPVAVTARDPAYAQYTSGTTGSPKAAVHGHGDPFVFVDAFARPAVAIGRSDVLLSVSKLYFAYGLGNSLFFPLATGCRAVLHAAHPRPDDIAEAVRRHRVTVLFSVPTFYAHLVAAGRAEDFGSVRAAVCAGEALTVSLATRATALLGCPILDGLGSTEVGQTFASNTLTCRRDATVGRALPPYRLSVRDNGGGEVPAGQVGTLWVAGPTLPLGYLDGGGAVADQVAEGDWLGTGDRAVLDDDGFLHLRGRADDMEMVGGISISPLEVEAVLSRHPAVTEVAVAGVVGPDGASRLQAFVVVTATATATAADDDVEAELLGMARAVLAPFKVPRSVAFVDALPRTPTGKLRRFVLRSGAWGAQTAERSLKRSR